MVTKRAGTVPVGGPIEKVITPISDQLARRRTDRLLMQAKGLDDNWIIVDVIANIPTVHFADRIFIASDTLVVYYDTESAWIPFIP